MNTRSQVQKWRDPDRGRRRADFGSLELIIVIAMLAILLAAFLPLMDGCAKQAQLGNQRLTEEKIRAHDSLLAYYDFQEGKGRVAFNSAAPQGDQANYDPSAYIGILRYGARWADARAPGSYAIFFDGKDDCITMGNFDIGSIDGADSMTLISTLLIHDLTDEETIVSKAIGPQTQFWTLGLAREEQAHRLTFTLRTGDGLRTLTASSGDLPTDVWLHVAASYDGRKMRLYLDGTEVGVASQSGDIAQDDSANVWIGDLPPAPSTAPFAGLVDDLVIFSTALPPELIREHYHSYSRRD